MEKYGMKMVLELRNLQELYDFYLERIENVDYIDQENIYKERLHDLRIQIDLLKHLLED